MPKTVQLWSLSCESNGCQLWTYVERIISYACYGRWDSDVCQLLTVGECVFPMVSTPSSRVAVFNAVHPLKASSDICFIDPGIVMLVSPEPANAKVPMPVIVCGRVMLARLVQF